MGIEPSAEHSEYCKNRQHRILCALPHSVSATRANMLKNQAGLENRPDQ